MYVHTYTYIHTSIAVHSYEMTIRFEESWLFVLCNGVTPGFMLEVEF